MSKIITKALFALLAAGSLAVSARAQSNIVYAVEYNQPTNRFGTINLLNGSFTRISSIGTVMINDIAYCPTNATLYGISNTTALVTFNKTNGTMTRVAALSISGIESLAFRYSDGVLFGATHTILYRINPATGSATSVGVSAAPTTSAAPGRTSASRRTAIFTSVIQARTLIFIGSTPRMALRRGWEKPSAFPT